MNNMNVIIADDHPIVLFGIRKSLEQIEWVNVVGEFEDSTALINNLPKLDANVLITDLSMPGDKYGDGITLIKYIKRHFPDISIIVLTMNNNPAILSAVDDLGARLPAAIVVDAVHRLEVPGVDAERHLVVMSCGES